MIKVASNPRLWIIDDEYQLSAALTSALMRHYEIETFKNPGEVLSLLKQKTSPPDAIVTDLKMPRIDGLEMVRQMRSMNLQIPVILASGCSDKESIASALNLGVRFFLEKPFPLIEIRTLLDRIIEEETQRKALGEKAKRLEMLTQNQNRLVELFDQRQIFTRKVLNQPRVSFHDADLAREIEARPEYSDSIKREILLRAQIQKLSAEGPLEIQEKRIRLERERNKKNGNSDSAT
jgi:response regulator RpfG family c-di-GMP phosphodiesterase